MEFCPFLLRLCTQSRVPCPHVKQDGVCNHSQCKNLRGVSFGEAFDIYLKAKDIDKTRSLQEYKRYIAIKSSLDKVYKYLNFTAKTPIAAFDRPTARRFKEEALKDYSAITVRDALVKIYSLLSDDCAEEYEARGLELPTVRKVTVSAKDIGKNGSSIKTGKPEITAEQKDAIRNFMYQHRNLALKADGKAQRLFSRRLTMIFFLCLCMGCRKGDALKMTWGNFVTISGRTYLKYRANKNGAEVIHDVSTDAYDFISPLRRGREPNEKCIPDGGASNTMAVTKGFYVGNQTMLSSHASKFMRLIDIAGWGTLHALRGVSSQITFGIKGAIAEAQSLGHTVSVAQSNYYNVNNESYGR